MSKRPRLSGWGQQAVDAIEVRSEDLPRLTRDAVLTRGLGRSYGDSSLPPPSRHRVAGSALADRIIAFDETTGVLRAEAGLSLEVLNRSFLPRCWFTPVSPGTKFVTLGGMVASDVHGKNHHCDGTIGRHVRSLLIRVADGRMVRCSPTEEPELFRATLGGMGLTGHILEVELKLVKIASPWLWVESVKVRDIDEYVQALHEAAPRWPMTVGWIDCLSRGKKLGRGLLMKGRWATREEAPPQPPRPRSRLVVPFQLPSFAMNPWTIRLGNAVIYARQRRRVVAGIMHPDSFFYPLDAVRAWTRLYGPRGMTQHQAVLPDSAGPGAVREFLELLTRLGGASPLCVIKDCGEEGTGLLSFPKPGISIAVDMQVRKDTPRIIERLNDFVIARGGRIYLTKDQFTRADQFRQMEPRLPEFLRVRAAWDPEKKIRSLQSVRLFGDPP